MACAERERLDVQVDGPPVRSRGRRVGRAVVAQAVEQGGLAHLGVAEEHEHAGAGDGGAGLAVFEENADGGGATRGDGEGRQLEGVAAHVQLRERGEAEDHGGQLRQLVAAI